MIIPKQEMSDHSRGRKDRDGHRTYNFLSRGERYYANKAFSDMTSADDPNKDTIYYATYVRLFFFFYFLLLV